MSLHVRDVMLAFLSNYFTIYICDASLISSLRFLSVGKNCHCEFYNVHAHFDSLKELSTQGLMSMSNVTYLISHS